MAATTAPLTVEEFSKLLETGPFYYELRHGELVPVTRPKRQHVRIQNRLQKLLERAAPSMLADKEFAFRPVPEYELRVAHIALISADRETQIDPDDYLRGAPDLVIEVLSPSNTVAEIIEKEKLCLENGSKEFWIVDPDHREVRVFTSSGMSAYRAGRQIPLAAFNGGSINVDDIFV